METAVHELTAGYALDALDPHECREYEAHLPGCARCQEELASFRETSAALAVAASGPAPSARLRERILAEARAEPPSVVVPLPSRRRVWAPALGAAAAVAAMVAVGIGLWAASLSNRLDDTRAALAQERAAVAILADPDAQAVSLQAGDGRLVVDPDGRAALVLRGLDPAPDGKTYEMWIAPGGRLEDARPAGLFPGRAGPEIVEVGGTVSSADVVAVTIEAAGGVDAPTSAPIVASEPA